MLIIVYRATKSQGKIRKISPVILLSAEEYRNPFSLQGKDILLALFFLLYALICILILLLRTSRHRKSVQFTCVFKYAEYNIFRGSFLSPGNCCILKPRNLLYCASNQYALLCGAFRINFCNQRKAALPCRNCVPYPNSLQLNYVHPHRLFMAVCSFFAHSMCQMSHSET